MVDWINKQNRDLAIPTRAQTHQQHDDDNDNDDVDRGSAGGFNHSIIRWLLRMSESCWEIPKPVSLVNLHVIEKCNSNTKSK